MIKTVILHNIQSHKDTTINFHEGVNVFVGLTDNGKTTIMRAIDQVCTNRPVGDDYLSYWADECFTTIILDSGDSVTRGRDKDGKNYYQINNNPPLRAFNREVPEEVLKILNISEINTQEQGDPPFLLSAGPGDVAQTLNKIVQLDVIDRATSNIYKKKLENDRESKYTKSRIVDLTKQLETFANLETMEADIIVVEQLSGAKQHMSEKIEQLETLLNQIEEKQVQLLAYKHLQDAEDCLETVLILQRKKEDVEHSENALEFLLSNIEFKQTELRKLSKIDQMEKDLQSVLELQQEMLQKQEKIKTLTNIMESIRIKSIAVQQETDILTTLEREFHELFPDDCPLCGMEVQNEKCKS
jgi:DNA repair protein SbcC/Rad50